MNKGTSPLPRASIAVARGVPTTLPPCAMRTLVIVAVLVLAAPLAGCSRTSLNTYEGSGGSFAPAGAAGTGGFAAAGGSGAAGTGGFAAAGGSGAAGTGGSAPAGGSGGGACGACAGGCCQHGTCIPPQDQTTQACGFGGIACEVCKPGGRCVKGACFYSQPECGPTNCSGCCIDANTCSDGISPDACGYGGHACQGCGSVSSLQACVPQPGGGGSCHPKCDPSNCHGCCQGDACLLGQSENACGTEGHACTACAPGESCIGGGADVGGACGVPCSPATCNGCCHGDVCAVGNQDIACGTGGASCSDCTTMHWACSASGKCEP